MAYSDKEPHGGRLQRTAGRDGTFINSFMQVCRRHGATMGCLALAGLFLPSAWDRLGAVFAPLFSSPINYLAAGAGLVVFFRFHQRRKTRESNWQNLLWLGYLLFISLVEEMAFRLFLPSELSAAVPFLAAVIISNALFALLHYFTLRWHWWNCLFTFAGGLGFSHTLHQSGDLALVILAHWFFTFMNTPLPPAPRPAAL